MLDSARKQEHFESKVLFLFIFSAVMEILQLRIQAQIAAQQ